MSKKSWVGDDICDNYCNNEYCNRDGGDCNGCSQDSLCREFWQYFELAANSNVEDYKLSIDEACQWFDAFLLVIGGEDFPYNCSQTIKMLDQNGDNLVNGDEAVTAFFLPAFDQRDEYRAQQLNCSMCAPSIDVYFS